MCKTTVWSEPTSNISLFTPTFVSSWHCHSSQLLTSETPSSHFRTVPTHYMNRQWFNNGVINIADWCIFKRSVRTNNDVEGWHNRLNTAAKHGGVPFYTLVPDLMKEAEVVDVSVRSDDLERDVHRRYTVLEQKIQTSWDSYMDGAMSTTHFLKVISRLYGPSDQPTEDVPQQ
ncbi:Hypothetical predicted protein [Mytilus galloprovincialis]|nr:Hypothetical predicted protein [Mytilus galloprovincialis]